jgi:ABC-type antimicrobial peptide transport system permease subunit
MFKNYLQIAFRNLWRNKSYFFINVLGLALGIGCSLLLYSLVTYQLSFDTFHPHSDRIYRLITEFHEEQVNLQAGVPSPLGKAFRNDFTFAEKIARRISFDDQLITIKTGNAIKKFQEEQGIVFAEPDLFDLLHLPLLKGEEHLALKDPNTAIITQKLADKYFPGEDPIGKTILIDNRLSCQVTGILENVPSNTDWKYEIYISYASIKQWNDFFESPNAWFGIFSSSHCFVRLKPGVSTATVEKALRSTSKKYYPAKDAKVFQFKLQPIADIHFNGELDGQVEKRNLWALSLIGLFLIITACVNFINLATVQALNRAKEVGVRKVLGSLPRQLFWQFMAETAVITLVALTFAYGLAQLGLPQVNRLFKSEISVNLFHQPQLLLFLGVVTLLVIFLAGAYPATVMSRFRPTQALKSQITHQQVGGFSLRRFLVVTQFAISQVLIIGAIVIAQQMSYSKKSNLGFNKDGVIVLPIPMDAKSKMTTLKTRLQQISGVDKITLCFQPPAANSNSNTGIRYNNSAEDAVFSINTKQADADFLSTFNIHLVAGRNYFPSDTTREFLVNETLVKKLNLKDPQAILGKNIAVNGSRVKGVIVGVIKDFYNLSFHTDIDPVCIFPAQKSYSTCALKVNLNQLSPMLPAIEKIWNETYPEYFYTYEFLDESIAEFYELDVVMLSLIQIFASIAIFIGCLGLYGLVSFMAIQKNKEIGVRKVLGATVANILWMFGKEFSRLIIIAFAIAAPLGWYAMHTWLKTFVYRIPLGVDLFLWAILSTFIIAAVTIGYQAIRSALANPVDSLRSE